MIPSQEGTHKVYRRGVAGANNPALEVRAIGRVTKEIGSLFKSSKTCLEWGLYLGQTEHKVTLEISKLSGKRRLYYDENMVAKITKLPNQKTVNIPFDLTTGPKFEVREEGKVIELFINGISFSSLLRQDYEKRLATDKLDVKLTAFAAEAADSENFSPEKEMAKNVDTETYTLQVSVSAEYPALRKHLSAGCEWPPTPE